MLFHQQCNSEKVNNPLLAIISLSNFHTFTQLKNVISPYVIDRSFWSFFYFFSVMVNEKLTCPQDLMFYDKGSYATWGNFPTEKWIFVNIKITTICTDSILWLVDSWYFKLSIDHHLWTVLQMVKDLSMLKTKCWWISEMWHSYLCQKTRDI